MFKRLITLRFFLILIFLYVLQYKSAYSDVQNQETPTVVPISTIGSSVSPSHCDKPTTMLIQFKSDVTDLEKGKILSFGTAKALQYRKDMFGVVITNGSTPKEIINSLKNNPDVLYIGQVKNSTKYLDMKMGPLIR